MKNMKSIGLVLVLTIGMTTPAFADPDGLQGGQSQGTPSTSKSKDSSILSRILNRSGVGLLGGSEAYIGYSMAKSNGEIERVTQPQIRPTFGTENTYDSLKMAYLTLHGMGDEFHGAWTTYAVAARDYGSANDFYHALSPNDPRRGAARLATQQAERKLVTSREEWETAFAKAKLRLSTPGIQSDFQAWVEKVEREPKIYGALKWLGVAVLAQGVLTTGDALLGKNPSLLPEGPAIQSVSSRAAKALLSGSSETSQQQEAALTGSLQ